MPSNIPSAARLPGEQLYLDAIRQDLSNDSLKLAYADWLEQQDDSRAEFIRKFVQASTQWNAKTKLPRWKKSDWPWVNALGFPLVTAIKDLKWRDDSILRELKDAVLVHHLFCKSS